MRIINRMFRHIEDGFGKSGRKYDDKPIKNEGLFVTKQKSTASSWVSAKYSKLSQSYWKKSVSALERIIFLCEQYCFKTENKMLTTQTLSQTEERRVFYIGEIIFIWVQYGYLGKLYNCDIFSIYVNPYPDTARHRLEENIGFGNIS